MIDSKNLPLLGLDHIGIVVHDLEATAAVLERTLGLRMEETENYKNILRIGFLPLGPVDIELIQPMTKEGLNADFLREQGEGVHHVAFAVTDLEMSLNKAIEQGAKLLLAPCIGARGRQIAFLEGEGMGGTILELVAVSEPDTMNKGVQV